MSEYHPTAEEEALAALPDFAWSADRLYPPGATIPDTGPLEGRVNSADFYGFEPGSLVFLKPVVRDLPDGFVEVTYRFLATRLPLVGLQTADFNAITANPPEADQVEPDHTVEGKP